MLKTLTWISLGLSLFGALLEAGSGDTGSLETAAEIGLLAKVLGSGETTPPSGQETGDGTTRR